MILVGDVGGTNARFALFGRGARIPTHHETLPSASFESLEAAALAFVGPLAVRPELAVLAIAGPVVRGSVQTTNLPWIASELSLQRALGVRRVRLLNDLVALGLGALSADERDLRALTTTLPTRGGETVAILASGTGLGEAGLLWDEGHHHPLPTEGGHADFAPRSLVEFEFLEFLRARLGSRVSAERVLSGSGLGYLYEFFRDNKGCGERPANRDRLAQSDDPNRTIGEMGAERSSDAASRALDLFVDLYGAEAGNLALRTLATGGVFVAGAMAASLLVGDRQATFLRSFADKGRFRAMLEAIPVAVVENSSIGLLGCARFAADNLSLSLDITSEQPPLEGARNPRI